MRKKLLTLILVFGLYGCSIFSNQEQVDQNTINATLRGFKTFIGYQSGDYKLDIELENANNENETDFKVDGSFTWEDSFKLTGDVSIIQGENSEAFASVYYIDNIVYLDILNKKIQYSFDYASLLEQANLVNGISYIFALNNMITSATTEKEDGKEIHIIGLNDEKVTSLLKSQSMVNNEIVVADLKLKTIYNNNVCDQIEVETTISIDDITYELELSFSVSSIDQPTHLIFPDLNQFETQNSTDESVLPVN